MSKQYTAGFWVSLFVFALVASEVVGWVWAESGYSVAASWVAFVGFLGLALWSERARPVGARR
jgi:hypothetical protein